MSSTDLFILLNENVDFDFKANPFWWPDAHSFWVIAGAILTQNTKWSAAEIALNNLKKAGLDTPDKISAISASALAELIKPSGFYNTKAKRLSLLCAAIARDFGEFESFKDSVSREWLLSQKGLGAESADAILCYACERENMLVDSYTLRILKALDYEFESYDEAKEWLENMDFEAAINAIKSASSASTYEPSINEIFARYHGLTTEFTKAHSKGKSLDNEAINLLKTLL